MVCVCVCLCPCVCAYVSKGMYSIEVEVEKYIHNLGKEHAEGKTYSDCGCLFSVSPWPAHELLHLCNNKK